MRSIHGVALDALPPLPVEALRNVVSMLSAFGRGSQFLRRRAVAGEFLTRLSSALEATSLDDDAVGAILRHAEEQLKNDALPTAN